MLFGGQSSDISVYAYTHTHTSVSYKCRSIHHLTGSPRELFEDAQPLPHPSLDLNTRLLTTHA